MWGATARHNGEINVYSTVLPSHPLNLDVSAAVLHPRAAGKRTRIAEKRTAATNACHIANGNYGKSPPTSNDCDECQRHQLKDTDTSR